MSDEINSPFVNEEDNSSHSNNNDVPNHENREKSTTAEKTNAVKDVSRWSIVHFKNDKEDSFDSFNDLIPSSWILSMGTLCLYPMDKHSATVQKLVKQCSKADLEWNCFPIKQIEEGIGKFHD